MPLQTDKIVNVKIAVLITCDWLRRFFEWQPGMWVYVLLAFQARNNNMLKRDRHLIFILLINLFLIFNFVTSDQKNATTEAPDDDDEASLPYLDLKYKFSSPPMKLLIKTCYLIWRWIYQLYLKKICGQTTQESHY